MGVATKAMVVVEGDGNTGDFNNNSNWPVCQVCGKMGHVALKCYHCFDHSYQMEDNHVAAFASNQSYSVDTNWYSDTGATDHITNDLDRLTMRERYHGNEQIRIASGPGSSILHVGQNK